MIPNCGDRLRTQHAGGSSATSTPQQWPVGSRRSTTGSWFGPCDASGREYRDVVLLSVVIPTRNRRELLLRCVGLLREQTQDPRSYEVVVVDDDSGDGSADAVEALGTPF